MTDKREPRDGYAEGLLDIGREHDDVFVLERQQHDIPFLSL